MNRSLGRFSHSRQWWRRVFFRTIRICFRCLRHGGPAVISTLFSFHPDALGDLVATRGTMCLKSWESLRLSAALCAFAPYHCLSLIFITNLYSHSFKQEDTLEAAWPFGYCYASGACSPQAYGSKRALLLGKTQNEPLTNTS